MHCETLKQAWFSFENKLTLVVILSYWA